MANDVSYELGKAALREAASGKFVVAFYQSQLEGKSKEADEYAILTVAALDPANTYVSGTSDLKPLYVTKTDSRGRKTTRKNLFRLATEKGYYFNGTVIAPSEKIGRAIVKENPGTDLGGNNFDKLDSNAKDLKRAITRKGLERAQGSKNANTELITGFLSEHGGLIGLLEEYVKVGRAVPNTRKPKKEKSEADQMNKTFATLVNSSNSSKKAVDLTTIRAKSSTVGKPSSGTVGQTVTDEIKKLKTDDYVHTNITLGGKDIMVAINLDTFALRVSGKLDGIDSKGAKNLRLKGRTVSERVNSFVSLAQNINLGDSDDVTEAMTSILGLINEAKGKVVKGDRLRSGYTKVVASRAATYDKSARKAKRDKKK